MRRRLNGHFTQRRSGSFAVRVVLALACLVLTAAPAIAAEPSPEHRAAVELLTHQRDGTLRTIQWTALAAVAVVLIGTAALRWSQATRSEARFRSALRSARLDPAESPEVVATAVTALLEIGPVEEIRKERARRISSKDSQGIRTGSQGELLEAADVPKEGEPAGSRLLRASAILQSGTARSEVLEPLLRPDSAWTPKELGRAAELCRKAGQVLHDEGWPLVYEILAHHLAGHADEVAKRVDEVRGIHLESAISDSLRKEFVACLVENGKWKKARAAITHLIQLAEDPEVMKREMGWIDVLERSTTTSDDRTPATRQS